MLGRGQSVTILMDELEALARDGVKPAFDALDEGKLRVYRARPVNVPQLPALWWALSAPAPMEQRDLARWRDTVNVAARIGVRHTDSATEARQLELAADVFREVVDAALAPPGNPLNGAAREAHRTSMVPALDDFNDTPVLCYEFTIAARLDRIIPT
jgi:hypothetical protein